MKLYIPEVTLSDSVGQEKKADEDSPAFNIASMHRYKNYKGTLKMHRKSDSSNQKQYRQHKHQQNKNNQKIKMGRKTTLWKF